MGESGAGKSTLVKLLARLYRPGAEGQILFDGVDLRDIVPAHLHQGSGGAAGIVRALRGERGGEHRLRGLAAAAGASR